MTRAPRVQAAIVDDLDSLFRAHYGRLVCSLTAACGSREVAADAVQEAFVSAHLHWRKIRGYDDPVGWIRRVAINKLRDEGRRGTRRQRIIDRLGVRGDDVTGEPDGPDDELFTLLAGLPRQQRIAMALHYVDDLPVAAIAAAMELSEGAVKFHLHEGRGRLRTVLGSGATAGEG